MPSATTINAPQRRGYRKRSWEQAAHLFGFDHAFDAGSHGRGAMRNFVFLRALGLATDEQILITRDFDATPAQVMRAHTDPELFARWVGPDGMDTKILDWDATTGGRWRYVATRDREDYGFHGCFHEVGEDRIVQTFTFDGQPDDVALETLRFEDLGDGRTRLHAQSLVDSFAGRDAWLASDMESGVSDGYAKLQRMVDDGAV